MMHTPVRNCVLGPSVLRIERPIVKKQVQIWGVPHSLAPNPYVGCMV